MVALCLGSGIYGSSLGEHVTQSGFFDDGSESAQASRLGDEHYGRDTSSHIVAIYTAPDGKTVDDPAFRKKVLDSLAQVEEDHPDQVLRSIGYFKTPDLLRNMADASKKHAFMSIQLKGDNDDLILKNYKAIQEDLSDPGVDIQLAGLLPLANELTGTIATDQQRAEVLAMPLVVVLLFFVFGGVIAAFLPGIIGGLTIAGALGIMRLTALSVPVHYFAQPVVTLIGLGIAIDYGLFVVSRFREELAEGYDTETAVRRTVVTAGRTIAFSSVLISASVGGLLLFPQGFLKSLTYAMIASVTLAAILSITVLPAILGMLGPNVDALTVRTLLRIPFLRNNEKTSRLINWLGDKLQKTKTSAEVENGFWGRLADRVMKRPVMFAAPILLVLIILILPLGNIALGGISEKYLPPTNPVRQAQEDFDRTFPGFRVEPITLVIKSTDDRPVTDAEVAQVRSEARAIPGFTEPQDDPSKMWPERPYLDGASKDPSVRVIQNGLQNRLDAKSKVDELRSISKPHDLELYVGGTPALEQDSVQTISAKLPAMILIAVSTTTILMFLAFGSLVLPIKAALMNALTLCSTLGVLTWIFVDGHLSSVAEFHADSADRAGDRVDHRGDIRAVDGLRGLPGVPHGRGPRARYDHRRGHSPRNRDHRPPDQCCGTGSRRGRWGVRLLRSGDDAVPRDRAHHRAAARRDRGPDVPCAVGHEASRQRLLVGAAVDEAAAGADRPRRDHPRGRTQSIGVDARAVGRGDGVRDGRRRADVAEATPRSVAADGGGIGPVGVRHCGRACRSTRR